MKKLKDSTGVLKENLSKLPEAMLAAVGVPAVG